MIALEPISDMHKVLLMSKYEMSDSDADTLISESNVELHNSKFFKMFIVSNKEAYIGTISLYEHSASVISIGPEIFDKYKRQGYAVQAMKAAMKAAKIKGYKVVFQQIRTDNTASIKLHTKLGFETDKYDYVNKNNHTVNIYLKSL